MLTNDSFNVEIKYFELSNSMPGNIASYYDKMTRGLYKNPGPRRSGLKGELRIGCLIKLSAG